MGKMQIFDDSALNPGAGNDDELVAANEMRGTVPVLLLGQNPNFQGMGGSRVSLIVFDPVLVLVNPSGVSPGGSTGIW